MTSILHAPTTNEEKDTYKIFVEVSQSKYVLGNASSSEWSCKYWNWV